MTTLRATSCGLPSPNGPTPVAANASTAPHAKHYRCHILALLAETPGKSVNGRAARRLPVPRLQQAAGDDVVTAHYAKLRPGRVTRQVAEVPYGCYISAPSHPG